MCDITSPLKLDRFNDPASFVPPAPGISACFVWRAEPAVVFTADMWHADVLLNEVTHSPGDHRHRQTETDRDPTRLALLCKRKRMKQDQVTNPQFGVNGLERFHRQCV